jgi:uncharacterized lipoprotein YehR (DUF1307 family)
LPQKLFRYLSEEALQNMSVPEQTGLKCQHMLEKMCEHYQDLKGVYGVDGMLRRETEAIRINIPVFEGTDIRDLAKTFGITSLSERHGDLEAARHYHPVTPDRQESH